MKSETQSTHHSRLPCHDSPDRDTRRGIARWILIVASVVTVAAAAAGIWYWVSTIARQRMFAGRIAEARSQLQLSKDEDALQSLSLPYDNDAPPEFRYLKALTLDRLARSEPANAEIRRAIEAAPDNPKYKGLELKMRMMARERSAVDQLIELNRDFASSAAVALFASYGFQAKSMLLEAEGNPKAAKYHEQRKGQTLDTAVTMAADIPELQPELLTFIIREEMSEEALQLINSLLKLDPDDLSLRSKKVRVLVALRKVEDAAELAKVLYEETGQTLQGATYLASVLAQAEDLKAHNEVFQKLVERFPRSTVIVTKYAVYLTRFGKLPADQKQIDDALSRQTDPAEREMLAFTSITLPIEVNAPEVAEELLRKRRKHLQDDLLADYFEARILYLRKQYGDAMRRMLKIVAAAKQGKAGSRIFATEALTWVQRILAEKVMTEQFDRVLDATEKSAQPRVKVATEDQLKALEQQADDRTEPATTEKETDPQTVTKTDSKSTGPAPESDQPASSSPSAENR